MGLVYSGAKLVREYAELMDGNFRVVIEGLKARKLNVLQAKETFDCDGLIIYFAENHCCGARTENKAL